VVSAALGLTHPHFAVAELTEVVVISPNDRATAGEPTSVGCERADELELLITRLRTLVTELTARLPDLADGVAWIDLDFALHRLQGALVAFGSFGPTVAEGGGRAVAGRGST
jgi:hypothetical protein